MKEHEADSDASVIDVVHTKDPVSYDGMRLGRLE